MSVRIIRGVAPRRLRWAWSYNRVLVSLLALIAAGFSVWRAVDPPRSVTRIAAAIGAPDLPEESFARRFAMAYISYDASNPGRRTVALAPYVDQDGIAALGFTPGRGRRRALGADIVQIYRRAGGRTVYVVGVDTDRDGVVYLSVTVLRDRDGSIAIEGYPAIVGPPFAGPQLDTPALPSVSDPALSGVVRRALSNYLAHQTANLSADLTPDAQISLASMRLRLLDLQDLQWTLVGRAVLATITATDVDGSAMTLSYELVVRRTDRWEVSAIQTIPTAH